MGFDAGLDVIMITACVLAGGYFAYQAVRLRGIYRPKKLLAWAALKAITLLCLLLAALGLGINLPAAGTTTIFLVDRSLSVADQAGEIQDYINRQLGENPGRRDRAAVVSFAREPMVEQPVSRDPGAIKLETGPDPNFTNIQRALEFCGDYFPRVGHKRLVLISDGLENQGQAEPVLLSLAERDINLAVLPVAPAAGQDVRLTALEAPAAARPGDRVTLEAVLHADSAARGTFRLFNSDRRLLAEQPVTVKAGDNRLPLEVVADEGAEAVFRGEISFAGDQNLRNNMFTVSIPLQGTAGVLVIGAREDTANIEGLLAGLGFTVACCRPGEAPREPGLLSAYRGVVLANVRHGDLPEGFAAALQKTVAEQGTGLLVVGGENAFGPGGYENTLLEQLLPVRSRMKGNEKIPDTGLVLVVDCSGSMDDQSAGVRKIEMVKEAAVKSMAVLDQKDRLGVLAFSACQEWVVPLGSLEQQEEIKDQIGQLAPGGGTLILPALEKAAEVLAGADVKVKHIILLTDGQGEQEGYDRVIQSIREEGITLSTVAVGQDACRDLLQTLAEKGGGRSYYTGFYQDIPEIFTKETYLATKKYLNNRQFVPRPAGTGAMYRGWSLPALYGYTGTGIKEGAEQLLESDAGDPVLARWQYGLGRVAAWTPDLSGKWSKAWIDWSGLQNFYGALLHDLLAAHNADGLDINITQNGGRVNVSAFASGYGDGQSCELLLLPPAGEAKKLLLEQTAPGVFEGVLDLEQTGSQALDFRLVEDGNILKQASRTVYLDYSPEFAGGREQGLFLPAAFGRVVNWSTNVFALPLERKSTAALSLDQILLALALAAFVGELWVRKR